MTSEEWIETEGARALGVSTLRHTGLAARDYHDMHVNRMRAALAAAYHAGAAAERAARSAAGGRVKSPRKARAAARNGKAGGRPVGTPNRCPQCGAGYSSKAHAACKGGA